ncbi:MAG: hypothetical protein KY453_00290 [Gemmatimonadetes bacterium]|nr:hypothetical protein [Gemmatimonadota bacterium]
MRTVARGWAAVLAAASIVGCGDPGGLALGNAENAVVTVGPGSSPLYTWTEGDARRLVVTDLVSGEVIWDIQALDAGLGFFSPVDHGVVPQGAQELVAARLLRAGSRHLVVVTLVGGGEARAEFIP